MLNGPSSLAAHTAWPQPIAGLHRVTAGLALAGLALLAGCTTSTRAPVVDLTGGQPAPVPAPAQNGTYVVKPGDTLYNIARATNTDVSSLIRWNGIADPAQLKVGQVLRLSGPAAGSGVAKPQPQPMEPPAEEPPVGVVTPEPAPAPAPVPVQPEQPQRAADANVINWAWPASGEIIQAFSAATKGIDIAGTPGDPVHAAADGKVMYSGNGVRGLGNLIIINHQNGFITAYAHNRTLLVKTGQEVKRGTKIAEIGQTDTTSPRLHFEVRRQGTPVNPLQYLPPR